MIDEARLVAAHARVDDGVIVRDEKQYVRMRVFVAISPVAFLGRDAFADIFDDAHPFTDSACGKRAKSLDGGFPNFKEWIGHIVVFMSLQGVALERHDEAISFSLVKRDCSAAASIQLR